MHQEYAQKCCMLHDPKGKVFIQGGRGRVGNSAPTFWIFWIRPWSSTKLATELKASLNSVEKYDCYNELFSDHNVMHHNVHNTPAMIIIWKESNNQLEKSSMRAFNEKCYSQYLYTHTASLFYIRVLITHFTYTMLPTIFNEPIVMNWHRSFFLFH